MGRELGALLLSAVVCLFVLLMAPLQAQEAPLSVADGIRVLDLPTNDLIYDPWRQRIYASIPSAAAAGIADTITTINPWTGELEASVFIGSEPRRLALSDDGQFLYVALFTEGAIRRLHIPSQTPDLQFALSSETTTDRIYAEDIEVFPGNPNSIAVSRRTYSSHWDVAIYDDGVIRPNTTDGFFRNNLIEFSGSADLLYGYDADTSGAGFRTLAVTADGVAETSVTYGLLRAFQTDMELEDGLIYSSSGQTVDPVALISGSTYAASGPIEVDTLRGFVHFLENDRPAETYTLKTFGLESFALLDARPITGISRFAVASSLIGWGNGGLAFRTNESQVYLLPEVPVPDDDLVAGFGPTKGLWRWMNDDLWAKLHPRSPEALATGDLDASDRSDVVVDFGPDLGLWKWMNDSHWLKMHELSPTVMAVGDLDGEIEMEAVPDVPLAIPDNDPAGAVSTLDVAAKVVLEEVSVRVVVNHSWVGDLRIVLRSPAGTEVVLLDRPGVPSLGDTGCNDANMDITFTDRSTFDPEYQCAGTAFGHDPWYIGPARPTQSLAAFKDEFSQGTWRLIVTDSALADTGSVVDWQLMTEPSYDIPVGRADVVASFSTLGLWSWMNDSDWIKLDDKPAEALAVGDLDGNGMDDVVVDFGPAAGLWRWMNNESWIKLHALSPEAMVTGDLDGNGMDDVVIDFGAAVGLWRWMNDANWVGLLRLSPEVMAAGDLDGSGQDDVVIDFGSSIGLWRWMNNESWLRLHNQSPELVITGDLDNNGMDEAVIDFGATLGLWRWMNNSYWSGLHADSPEVMATGNLDGL